jgi:hypothetical protein
MARKKKGMDITLEQNHRPFGKPLTVSISMSIDSLSESIDIEDIY